MVKSYRFFYHYYKQKKRMSVHFQKQCLIVDDVECRATCETKWNPTQPSLVMRGWATRVDVKVDKNNRTKAIIYGQ